MKRIYKSSVFLLFMLVTYSLLSWKADRKSLLEKETVDISNQNKFVSNVKVDDFFWSPKMKQWSSITVNDVFDKFEGQYDTNSRKYLSDEYKKLGRTRDAFLNFDLVAQSKKGIHKHDGPEWYDGLVYESITGASNFLKYYPDKKIEERIDNYVNRIEAAQNAVGDGYLNTYTILVEPEHRWGLNGGFERGQHDVYNSGALIEAGIHYYKATGKTKLLNIAVRCANNICNELGPAPKKNVIPGHSLPEEAMVKLYWLFKDQPNLKNLISENVNENEYLAIAKFWIESRGNHCGLPLWRVWPYEKCDKWVRDNKYTSSEFGAYARPSWGSYNQDSIPFQQQKTIEGHAVRAVLFATGVAAVALESNDKRYIETSSSLWDNMVGKRMYLTGGIGSIHHDEMFGPDYFLPNNGYCETCAAVSSCFLSARMAELHKDGRYFDEFERSLYNNVISGISLSGDKYFYENPIEGQGFKRWNWHECPCCPPMFLKIVSEIPEYIYSNDGNSLYVNLFIGSEADIKLDDNQKVTVKQTTNYPWDGNIAININPDINKEFSVKVRIPGWAQNIENPYGLYSSNVKSKTILKINGEKCSYKISDGYMELKRKWSKGDVINLSFPFEPRIISANRNVKNLVNMVALGCGPLVYGIEECDNQSSISGKINVKEPIKINYFRDVLNGVNVITAKAVNNLGANVELKAIPFFCLNNRNPGNAFKVWIPVNK